MPLKCLTGTLATNNSMQCTQRKDVQVTVTHKEDCHWTVGYLVIDRGVASLIDKYNNGHSGSTRKIGVDEGCPITQYISRWDENNEKISNSVKAKAEIRRKHYYNNIARSKNECSIYDRRRLRKRALQALTVDTVDAIMFIFAERAPSDMKHLTSLAYQKNCIALFRM